MKADDYKYVLSELVEKISTSAESSNNNNEYSQGRRMALFEMLDAIQLLSEDVGIELSEIGINKIEKNSLVGLKKAA